MEGLKRKRRCEIECKDHIFAVQTLKGNSSKYDIKLQFCPKYQREPLPPEHIYPEYNDDGKFYTSAFILGVDRRVLVKNEQQQLMDHQKQIRDSLEKHNQLVFPRPNSKHSLCSVCKEHYKNYYFHIATLQHREKIGLSLYNNHIKELCSIYMHLWEGAEEKADIEAELRAQQEEKRRQELAELVVQEEEEEDDDELLDVQRGSRDVQEQEEYEQQQVNYTAKPVKKHSKSVFKDDDTIPFTAKTSKRVAPEGRTYTSDYLRKKFQYNAINHQEHAHRQREQRRYQRERDKLKTQRDNHERNKDFVKITEKEGDVFTIMKAAFAINNAPPEPQPQKQPEEKLFVWKSTTSRFRIKQATNQKHESALDKFEKENKKYQIDNSDKFATKPFETQLSRPYYQCYYRLTPFVPDFKSNINDDQMGQTKKSTPYPHPYMYPPPSSIYDPHFRPHRTLQKENGSQRSFDHVPPPYWAYPPYFMPTAIETNEQTANSSHKQLPNNGPNTNININFPVHLCPPYGPNRYPPYSDYPYSQSGREGKDRSQINHHTGQIMNGQNNATKTYSYPSYRHREKFHHQNAPPPNLG